LKINRRKAPNEEVAKLGYHAWLQLKSYNITRSWRHCLFPTDYPSPPELMLAVNASSCLSLRSRVVLAQTCRAWRYVLFKHVGFDPDIHPDRNTYGVIGVQLLEKHARSCLNKEN
jgi:hypothetical protein